MDRHQQVFDIIAFSPAKWSYYPTSLEQADWMPPHWVKHTQIDIPLGHSRYGGPVLDLPPGLTPPQGLRFAAQLDLSRFSPFDPSGLLPSHGQLIFFADILTETIQVFYTGLPNDQLIRTINEHEDQFFLGTLIDSIFHDQETLAQRMRPAEGEEEKQYANADGKIWDYFAGSDKSKVFGILTHCQYSPNQIEAITFSDKVLLLQVGENGFNDTGVFSVLISRDALASKDFSNCEFVWGQS